MLKGVRTKEELKALGLSNRMIARVGALLARKVQITSAALEVAASEEAVAKALLSKDILQDAGDLTEKRFAEILAASGTDDEAALSLQVEGEWHTIALGDEILAVGAFDDSAAETQAEGDGTADGAGAEHAQLDRPVKPEGGVEELFSSEEIKRLEMLVATSADEKMKVEAMRKLAYSPLSAKDRGKVFTRALSDQSAEVRVAAAELLVGLGLEPDLGEAIRELTSENEREKLYAIGRIGKLLETGQDLDVGAGLVSLLSSLRQEEFPKVRGAMLKVLRETAPVIAASPERIAEVVRIAMSLLAADIENLGRPVRLLLRALGQAAPEAVEAELWDEYGKTSEDKITALLLAEAACLPHRSDEPKLARALASEIARRREEDSFDFHQLGDRLLAMGDLGVSSLIEAFPKGGAAVKRYILILLNDLCRYRGVSKESLEASAGLLVRCLETEMQEVRVSALFSQIPWQQELSAGTRARLAEAFLDNIHVLAFPPDVEDAEYTVAKMGLPATDALAARLDASYPAADRIRAARVLGDLTIVARDEEGRGGRDVERIARDIQRFSFGEFPDKGALFVALGKLTTSRFVERELVRIVERMLIERQNEPGVGTSKYEALGWLASSQYADKRRVRSIITMFQGVLNTEPPEIPTEFTPTDDGILFDVGSEADYYTEVIPEAIKGLRKIALGEATKRDRREDIIGYLIHKWMAMVAGQAMWGPGNAGEMVEALREIGCDERTTVTTREKIIKALGKRVSQIPVQAALGRIFAADDDSRRLAKLASSAALAMLKRTDEFKELDSDDRQHYCTVLTQLAGRTALDTSDKRTQGLRMRLADEVFEGLRDRVPGSYDLLAALRDKERLPKEFREELERKLKPYEQIEVFTEGG